MPCMGQEPGAAHLTAALLLSQLDPFSSTNTILNTGIIRLIANLFCKSFDFGGLERGSQHLSHCASPPRLSVSSGASPVSPHANSYAMNNKHIIRNIHMCRYVYQSPPTKMPRFLMRGELSQHDSRASSLNTLQAEVGIL